VASESLTTLLAELLSADVELLLRGTGHSLLMTTLGPLDVLGAIEGGRDYDGLLDVCVSIEETLRRLRG
jgi:hypothetical protein